MDCSVGFVECFCTVIMQAAVDGLTCMVFLYAEQYEACYDDYAKALEMLKQVVEPDSRILAELYCSTLYWQLLNRGICLLLFGIKFRSWSKACFP